ncbi:Ig-like domain repeat protein [Cellulomonas gilvus]|uniref:Uncharacterized protein n=1 Tax=Cellulomonas gilvus (strain ATCC 13127 / NRRL B-14078) TaxID=593907 RepID=F8A5B8_CELGA|nr:Ig-like domain repeat protein [Cellulomonas gilvus]AEI10935.1 hypothetical protein Celgi_0413 [Cellulomonas gilvus ATCC 13127]
MYLTRTRRRLATAAVLAASLLAAAAPAQAAPAQPAAAEGVIEGQVTWPAAVPASRFAMLYEWGAVGRTPLQIAPIDDTGHVSFAGLGPTTRYVVQVFAPCTGAATGFYDGRGELAASSKDAVAVTPGGPALSLEPALDAMTEVTVQGEPWASIEPMYLVEPGTGAVLSRECYDSTTTTGRTWFVEGLTAGTPAVVELWSGSDPHYGLGAGRAFAAAFSRAGAVRAGSPVTLYREGVESTSSPVVSGEAKVGAVLTASAGTWSPAGGAVGYSWLRDGVVISGATGASYAPVVADVGKRLSVRVTSQLPDLGLGVEVSAPTAPVRGPAPVASAAPRVVGTAAVGKQLAATAGTWDVAGVTLKYQWVRSGVAISGATASRYTVTTKDVGKRLAVRVTASAPYRPAGVATSAVTGTVPKVTPVVTTRLVSSSVKAGTRAKAVVTVKAAGMTAPTGKVTVTVGSKKVTVTLGASAKGKVTVTLPAMPRGSYKVKAAFAPSTTAAAVLKPAAGAAVTLRVV